MPHKACGSGETIMQSRRKFMRQAFSLGLGFAVGGELVFPNRSEAQFVALAEELIAHPGS